MKKQIKKIVLAKETLRSLSATEAAGALGGAFPQTNFNTCRCPTAISCQHVGFC
jgi:hypothetical protein